MPILNFKAEFAQLVQAGVKKQTIRAKRKYPVKVGDRLYLYTGLRTKYANKLKETVCTGVFDLVIAKKYDIYVDGAVMFESMKESFAYADGFGGLDPWENMIRFFRRNHGLPFHGDLILWDQDCQQIKDYINRRKEEKNISLMA